LGHLHHEPTERDYAELGRLDVVMVPVDGGMTVDLPTMMKVTERLKSSVVIPMHWFGDYTLQLFLDGMSQQFAIQRPRGPSIDLSLRTLPTRPTIIVLDPDWLRDE
jgi:L-ascorbate metabolism protein UlaG (beta-lactamase superfamily)